MHMPVARAFRRWTHYRVTGDSMRPSLEPGDRVIVDQGAFTAKGPRNGDVVVCRHPYVRSSKLIKRIGEPPTSDGGDGYWLVGDAPSESTDSRSFGPVRDDKLIGKVAWRYWPLSRAGKVT